MRQLDNPDVGTIILHRLSGVQGLTISATSLAAPQGAQKAYEKAEAAIKKQKWEDAEKQLRKAVEAYPKYAIAWYKLGLVQERLQDAGSAKQSFSSAIQADAKLVTPYLRLASMALADKQWQEALDYSGRLIALNATDFPLAYYYNCIANFQLTKWSAAEQSALAGAKADREHRIPRFDHILGLIYANEGNYPASVEHLKAYLAAVPDSPEAKLVSQQLAEVEGRAANQPPKP